MSLYNIVFDFQYRKTLISDGQTRYLAQGRMLIIIYVVKSEAIVF